MIETATPEQVGMSSSRVVDLRATMQAFVDDGQFAGIATLISRYGQIVDSRCYGKLDIAANKPLQPDSLFRIMSLTKPVTAVAALMLVEEGRLKLDEPVYKWIPEFKNCKVCLNGSDAALELRGLEREITCRHLLSHTSGLGYGFVAGPIGEHYAAANLLGPVLDLQFPLPEFVQKLAELPLAAQPGATWQYSLSTDVVGYLIGIISGKPFDVFLRERIFAPLGMPDTGFFVPPAKLSRLGPLYGARGEKAELSIVDEVVGSPFVSSEVVPSGGGGLVSSVPDYLGFLRMLANGGELEGVRLLQPSTVAEMTTNQLISSDFPGRSLSTGDGYGLGLGVPGEGYGLGLGVRLTDAPEVGLPSGAFGWWGASGTTAWIYPGKDMIVLCMTQSWDDFTAGNTLLKMAYAALVN